MPEKEKRFGKHVLQVYLPDKKWCAEKKDITCVRKGQLNKK